MTSSMSSSLITLLTLFPCSASPSCIAIPSLIICAHSTHAASLAVCAINCWPTSAWLHTSCTPTAPFAVKRAVAFLTACWRASSTFASVAPSTSNCLPPVITVNLFSHSFTGRNSPTFPSLSILVINLPASFFPFPLSCPIILLLPNSCRRCWPLVVKAACCLVLASVPLVRLSVANGALYFFVAVSPVLL
ncbi:hypothetical protein BDZ91DRAFT_756912 [Kalaharituber pfeilii]|nr:hypothetical protein BDZ91DRAFT_756912 [Kalaharituber pfeilii]